MKKYGKQLPFSGVMRLPICVMVVKREEVFVVSRINKNAILSIKFLVAHNCSMEYDYPIVQVDRMKLKCTDWHGRLLVSNPQVSHELFLPSRTEMVVSCRLATRNVC